jgi:hypothetical protein
MLSSRKIN